MVRRFSPFMFNLDIQNPDKVRLHKFYDEKFVVPWFKRDSERDK